MARTGRPAKAVEQHAAEGTRSQVGRGRGGKAPATPTVVGGRGAPVKPRGLTKVESVAWDEIAELCRVLLDRADGPMVEAGAAALAMLREANAAWAANPNVLVVNRFGDEVANPVLRVRRDALVQWRQFAEQLGIGPAARARLAGLAVEGRSAEDEIEGLSGEVTELRVVKGGRAS